VLFSTSAGIQEREDAWKDFLDWLEEEGDDSPSATEGSSSSFTASSMDVS
jgi:hypothetical protein